MMRDYECFVHEKRVHRIIVQADDEYAAEVKAEELIDEETVIDGEVTYIDARLLGPVPEGGQPDPNDFTHVLQRDIRIDATAYGPVPLIEMRMSVHRDKNGNEWAMADGRYYLVENRTIYLGV